MSNRFDNWALGVVSALLSALAFGSFVLSFGEISARAFAVGLNGNIFAAVVDGSVLVFAVGAFVATKDGRYRVKWTMTAFSLLFVGLSVWFNVGVFDLRSIEAVQKTVIHALPPVALLLAFEFGLLPLLNIRLEKNALTNTMQTIQAEIKRLNERHTTKTTEAKREINDLENQAERLLNELSAIRASIATAQMEKATDELTEIQRQLLEHMPNATSYAELAKLAGLGKHQAYAHGRKLIDLGLVEKVDGKPFAVCLN